MVTYTSTELTDVRSTRVDRHRPALSVSPLSAALVDTRPRAIAYATDAVKGGLCPAMVVARTEKSQMTWQPSITAGGIAANGTSNNSIVFGGFGFDHLTDDTFTEVGPPPPRRTSV